MRATEVGWRWGVGLCALVGLAVRAAILARPIAVLDRLFVPDDTYYTLTIARSLAHGAGPTAGAHILTSGFQPLIAFLMVPVFWVTHSPDAALRVDMGLLALADVVTIVLVGVIVRRLFGGRAAVVAAGLWALSPVACGVALAGLESSLALMCEALLILVWLRAQEVSRDSFALDRRELLRWTTVGAVAGLAVLARVDAVLLIALLGLVQLVRGPRRGLVPAAVAGAVVLGPWWGWCAYTFGSPIPSSGSAVHTLFGAQSFASSTFGLAVGSVIGGPVVQVNRVQGWLGQHAGFGVLVFVLFAAMLPALSGGWFWRRLRSASEPAARRDATFIAGTFSLFAVALLVFYVWLGVPFYFTRYLVSVALLIDVIVSAIAGVLLTRVSPRRVGTWAVAGGLVLLVGVSLRGLGRQLLRSQPVVATSSAATGYRAPMRALLPLVPRGSVIAAPQSGALGYYGGYAGLTAINLDGVVNTDAQRAEKRGLEGCYMFAHDVGWIAEWPVGVRVVALPVELQGPRGTRVVQVARVHQVGVAPSDYELARIDWGAGPSRCPRP